MSTKDFLEFNYLTPMDYTKHQTPQEINMALYFNGVEVKPSKEALEKAVAFGKQVAYNGWITPIPEEHYEEEGDDPGNISQSHREQWEQTTVFDLLCADHLSDLTDAEEIRISGDIGGLNHLELARYEGIFIPLKDAFWEAWEEEVDFYGIIARAFKDF